VSLLNALNRSGSLRPLDYALAQTLHRLQADTDDSVLAAAALASLAVAQGHSGFDPAQPDQLLDASLPWPAAQQWIEQLQQSPWVSEPEAKQVAGARPLVWERGLLYLRRYREYERRLAAGLQRIAQANVNNNVSDHSVSALFACLFPPDHDAQQRHAAQLAQKYPLLLISGGPGTGKTSTIARLLLVRVAQARASGQALPRIALVAPTGRAAERMAESVRRTVQSLTDVDRQLSATLPSTGSTVHRLLGVIPDSPEFRHHADNLLPFDIIVIDEASMIDLPLMCKLVQATATGSQILLLGDPDQLPSVESGDVLHALVQASAAHKPTARTNTLAHVHLQRSYRQSQSLQLAPLAQAVREGDSVQVLNLLRSGELSGVQFYEQQEESAPDLLPRLRQTLHNWWRDLTQAPSPAQALLHINRLRLLTATREGAQGSRRLNTRIEYLLNPSASQRNPSTHFHGRLVLITENSYRLGLYNGDIGLCLHSARTGMSVWFAGNEEPHTPRSFHPSALPAHESAFAMTIHKAQGSEFDQVWLQLPAHEHRVLSRELLYTGLTRARERLYISANAAVLESTLARHTQRCSGLYWRLKEVL